MNFKFKYLLFLLLGLSLFSCKKKDEENLFIDTWLMSCRVLKRGMEDFTLNSIVDVARQHGFQKIVGEYLPTSKNQMVELHYERLGFQKDNGGWVLNVEDYKPKEVYIQKI